MDALALTAVKDMFSYESYALATEVLVFQGCTLKTEVKTEKDVETEMKTARGVKKVMKREKVVYPPGTRFEQICVELNLKVYLDSSEGENLGISEHNLPDGTVDEMDVIHLPDGTVKVLSKKK
jgi:hypothetical protein